MREIKPTKKSFLAKIFIKLCRVLGFEIIDQSNLSIPTSKKFLIEGISIHSRNSENVNYKIFGKQDLINPLLKKYSIPKKRFNLIHTDKIVEG